MVYGGGVVIDHARNVVENAAQIATNKIANAAVATSVAVTTAAEKAQYIDFSEAGFFGIAYINWFQIISCTWLLIQIGEWAYKKISAIAEKFKSGE